MVTFHYAPKVYAPQQARIKKGKVGRPFPFCNNHIVWQLTLPSRHQLDKAALALSARTEKDFLSYTAISAKTLRSISMVAFLSPFINRL